MGESLDLAGFSVRITLDPDSATRAFAGAGIGLGALASDWEAAAMADTAVAVNRLQPLQIGLNFPAKIPFDENFRAIDGLNDGIELLRAEVFGPGVGINSGEFQHLLGVAGAHAVDVGQRSFDALFAGDVDSEDTWHKVRMGCGW